MELFNQECPYIGLIPFTDADSEYFFGRDKEIDLIIANLFASKFTLLYGKSGVGKSSIMNAGVLTKLRDRKSLACVIFKEWRQESSTGLKISIYNAIKSITGKDIQPLNTEISLREFLHQYLDPLPELRLMIIFDQFEDYFLYTSANDPFSIEFPSVVMDRELAVSFLVSIREDSVAKIDRFEGSIPVLFDNILKIDSLNSGDARDAITKPIGQYNTLTDRIELRVEIEEALVNSVLDQIKTGEVLPECVGHGVLNWKDTEDKMEITIETPYLQLVMMRLWREERAMHSSVLRMATLDRLGGAKNIIRKHLDDVMTTLTFEDKKIAAGVLRYLVTPGGSKISHTIPDLANYTDLPGEKITSVLEKLAGSNIRIISPVAPAMNTAELRYEIYHDFLASPILDWRNRFEKEMQQNEMKRQTMKKLLRIGRYIFFSLSFFIFLFMGIAYINIKKANTYYKNLQFTNSKLENNLVQIFKLKVDSADRLKRMIENVDLRQALISGDSVRIDTAIRKIKPEQEITFRAERWKLPYKSLSGKDTYRFRIYPDYNTITEGIASVAMITYFMNNPTFLNPLIASGPNSKFVGMYDGINCVNRIIAIIEYTDINKPSTVAQFDMCKDLIIK
jgi:hypothetical protein